MIEYHISRKGLALFLNFVGASFEHGCAFDMDVVLLVFMRNNHMARKW
jgi:hypothetical protein